MEWQDFVLTAGTWVFIFALVPTLRAKEKPTFVTSFLTGTTLIIFAVVYASLALWISVVSSALLAILWYILAIQKYKSIKK